MKKALNINGIATAILAMLTTFALPDALGITQDRLYITNTIFTVFLYIGLWYGVYTCVQHTDWSDKKATIKAFLMSLMFATCMVIGAELDSRDFLILGQPKKFFSVFILAVTLTIFVRRAWDYLSERVLIQGERLIQYKNAQVYERIGYRKRWLVVIFVAFLICWLPVLLAVYPGFFVYDAQDELNQVLTRNFTNHHPLFHVLMLGGSIALVHKLTGSYNLGICFYMIIQMMLLSACFTYVMNFMKRHGAKKSFQIGSFLFMALFPVIPMYVLCSSKDTLFTAALLVVMIHLYEMLKESQDYFEGKRKTFCFFVMAVMMMSFRHNGFYAFVVLVVICAFYLWRKKKFEYKKQILGLMLGAVVTYLLLTKLLTWGFAAQTDEHQEMLTVPIMQLTRVYNLEEEAYSAEDKALLYEFLEEEALQRYNPKLADPVKYYFNNKNYEEKTLEFWKLWWKIGVHNIGAYINAWFYTSYGFWYPDTVIDVYAGNQTSTFVYEDSSYFGYETEAPGVRESMIPWLDELYRQMSLEIAQQKIPVISMLFSPGFMFWCYLFTFCYFWKEHRYERMLFLTMPMLLWLTVLLGPTYLVRYVLIFWFAFPVLITMLFEKHSGFER